MKRIKKQLSIVLAICILITFTIPTLAATKDVSGNWAEAKIEKWLSAKLISGYNDGSFRPNNNISRAEFAVLINSVFNYVEKSDVKYTDVNKAKWYADVVSKVTAAKAFSGSEGKFRPEDAITRQEAATVLANAFSIKTKDADAYKKFADAGKVSKWATNAVSALFESKYISGRGQNMFAPQGNITRAESVTMIDNIMGELKNQAGTYTGAVAGNITVNTPNVVLKDMVISGSLFLAQGIGSGEITLENVTVKGDTVVKGGGANSIVLKNSKLEGTLMVIKADGKVRVVAQGTTEVAKTQLSSGAKLQEEKITGKGFENVEVITLVAGQALVLDGDFKEVSIEVEAAQVQMVGGKIETLSINAPKADVKLDGGVVGKLVVTSKAKDSDIAVNKGATVTLLKTDAAIEVKGQGTIKTAEVNVSGVKMEKKPDTLTAPSGIKVSVEGKDVQGTITAPIGGGGFPSNPAVAVTDKKVIFKNDTAVKTVMLDASNAADISTNPEFKDSDVFQGISFKLDVDVSKITLKSVTAENIGTLSVDKVFNKTTKEITFTVAELIGMTGLKGFEDGITIADMKKGFGSYLTVTADIEAANKQTSTYTAKIVLMADGGNTKYFDQYASTSYSAGTLTVTIKQDAALSSIELFLTPSIDKLMAAISSNTKENPQIKVGNNDYSYSDLNKNETKNALKAKLATKLNKPYEEIKLNDLKGLSMKVSKGAGADFDYTILVK